MKNLAEKLRAVIIKDGKPNDIVKDLVKGLRANLDAKELSKVDYATKYMSKPYHRRLAGEIIDYFSFSWPVKFSRHLTEHYLIGILARTTDFVQHSPMIDDIKFDPETLEKYVNDYLQYCADMFEGEIIE